MIWFSASDLHQFAKLRWLAGLSFADDLSVRFKDADKLAGGFGVPNQDARLRLPDHLSYLPDHGLHLFY
jgi:hypothetical protein